MAKYYGLTDDPERRKVEHGNPRDWKIEKKFTSEHEARKWEKEMVSKPGSAGDTGGKGWKYGYSYTKN